MIQEDGVKFIMMLGGDPWPGVEAVAAREGMLVSTLLPSDLTPETTTLVAPCEVHPIYNVTGVEWLAENRPELKTAVICAQDDALGKPSVATYLAAFEAAGIEVQGDPLFFDPATTDFAPVMTQLLSGNPDILCLDTCYADYVAAALRAGVPAGLQGPDHLLHARLLQTHRRADVDGVHGRRDLPVPGFRRSEAERGADQLPAAERLLRRVRRSASAPNELVGGVVGIRLDHGALGRRRDNAPAAPSRTPCSPR